MGVVGAIVPWNYPPLLRGSWRGLAAGNTLVAKPLKLTPLSTLALSGVEPRARAVVVPVRPGRAGPSGVSGAQPNSRESFSSVLRLPRGRSRPVAMARFGSSRPANTSTQSS